MKLIIALCVCFTMACGGSSFSTGEQEDDAGDAAPTQGAKDPTPTNDAAPVMMAEAGEPQPTTHDAGKVETSMPEAASPEASTPEHDAGVTTSPEASDMPEASDVDVATPCVSPQGTADPQCPSATPFCCNWEGSHFCTAATTCR